MGYFEELSEYISVVGVKELAALPHCTEVTFKVRVPLKPPGAPATVPMLSTDQQIVTAAMNLLLRELNPAADCSETTVQELARTLLQGMARYSHSPVVFNTRKAMETALATNDWLELARLACHMREAIERDVPTD